ncbi:hypothetical protein H7K45_08135 [Mycobacterium yunnanensis]|uniref:Lipoprotein LppV n=1 Tax=Mycobacterium yunnanensis TaxID=368477 RepID=A0A9X2YZX2_9MYCO|nr:hypothetical protein [Mycobacterium yunnanensis]
MSQPDPPTPTTTAAQALDQLKSLPSLEDTKTQLQGVVDEIKDAANRVVPDLGWQTLHGETAGNCQAPFEQTDGKRLFLPDEVAPGADVSEEDWAAILSAARAAAAKLDATDVQVMQDGPRNHDVGFYGPTGIFVKVGYQGNLTIASYTGCRLPNSAK